MILNKSGKVLLTLSSVLVGFLLVILIKANISTANSGAEVTYQSLSQVEQENQQLESDNQQLREELAQFDSAISASQLVLEQLDKAQLNAGLKTMTGPGVKITLDDSKAVPKEDDNINFFLIHEEYLREIVNRLWNGGAEAISINGQRITTHTAILCNGSNIQINGYPKYPPYTIEAIGDPNDLQSALKFGIWEQLAIYQKDYNIIREVVPVDSLTISAARVHTYKYAEPIKEGS